MTRWLSASERMNPRHDAADLERLIEQLERRRTRMVQEGRPVADVDQLLCKLRRGLEWALSLSA